jgi:hypothetical protein
VSHGVPGAFLAEVQRDLTAPRKRECLACYVGRMLDEFGCDDTLRWARHWRAVCAPRATGMTRRLASRGGFCDCEIALNVYPAQMMVPEGAPRPACAGVSRRGSTTPCRGQP